ncbi:phage tail tape measure protein [Aquimarina macrocephali]|uniref:phage tail tape measure protein n=1 Tax=Aquimarina macrocephali TaxID=666563 RepID=UPI003F665935
MAGKGKITRKEVVENKVLTLGKDYAKGLQPAIDANKKWVESFEPIKKAALEYAKLEQQFKVSKARKEFLQIKQQEEVLRKKAADALKAEQNALISLQKIQTEKLRQDKLIIDVEAKKQAATRRGVKLTIEEKVKTAALNKIKRDQARVTLGLLSPYQKLSKELDKARLKAKDIGVQFGDTSKQFKKAQVEVLKLDSRLKKLDVALGQSQRFVGQYGLSLKGLRGIFLSLTSALGFTGGLFAFVTVMRNSFSIIRGFSKEMANLRAITKSNGKEFEVLAKQLGETTVFTASEAAKAMSLLGMAGFNVNQILKATPEVLDLAAAGGIGLAEAADIASNVLSGFGLQAEQTGMVVDVLAKTATSTNTTILTLGESFKEIAPTANNLKIPIQEVAAAVGLLGNSGIKGTDATTSLNTALNRLAAPTKKMKKKMRELNVEFFDANGQFIGITNTVKLLNERFVGLTDRQKAAAVSIIFGNRVNKQMTSLINGQTTALINNEEVILKGSEALEHLTGEYYNASDAAKEMADTQLDSLDGALRLLSSAWEGYILGVDDSTNASSILKDGIKFLAQNLEKIINTIALATGVWIAYKGITVAVGLAKKIATAYTVAYRISVVALNKGLLSAIRSMKVFRVALINTGIGAAIIAITALIVAFRNMNVQRTIAEKKQRLLNNARKEAAKSVAKEKAGLDTLIKTAKNENLSKEQRLDAIKKLNKISPEYLGNITLENINTDETTNAIKRYIEELDRKALSQALQSKKAELYAKLIDSEKSSLEDNVKWYETLGNAVLSAGNTYETATRSVETGLKNRNKEVASIKEEIEALNSLIKKKSEAGEIDTSGNFSPDEVKFNEGDEKDKNAEKSAKKRVELEKKLAKDAISLAKFVVQQRIKFQKEIFNNEEKTFEEREDALKEFTSLELELAILSAKGKFDIAKGFSDKEIESLLSKSKVSKNTLKKVTDEELLIIAEYQAKKKQIEKGKENNTDTLDLQKIKKEADLKVKQKQKQLNDELRLENEAFNKREGIYSGVEDAVERREKRIAEIKKRYALEALNTQVKAVEQLLANEELSASKRAEYERQLSEIKLKISNLTTEHFIENDSQEVLSTQEKAEQIGDISSQLAASLGDLANSIFEARIQKIDDEIAKNDEKFEKLLENENLSEEKRKALEKKKEKEREALEKKKRKEQRKQAKLNKALAIADVAIATALGIMQAYAQMGPIAGSVGAALVGVIGAIQIAAIIAKPIPQYAKGTEYHPGGFALVGEERAEVIAEPNKAPYVVDSPSILDLPEGTRVTPSLSEYERLFKASILTSIDVEKRKLDDFQSKQSFNSHNRELIMEMQLTRKAIEKNKTNVTVHQPRPVDFEHELFKLKNTDWSA